MFFPLVKFKVQSPRPGIGHRAGFTDGKYKLPHCLFLTSIVFAFHFYICAIISLASASTKPVLSTSTLLGTSSVEGLGMPTVDYPRSPILPLPVPSAKRSDLCVL